MRLTPADMVGGFYADATRPWSQQDTVNWIPVRAERPGTRSEWKLRGVPGLDPFADVGNGPIRVGGMRDVEGKLFVVAGTQLCEVRADGSHVVRGTIPGNGPVSMAHNQRSGGNEVLVVNGSQGYVWNTVSEDFDQVTDDGYPGAIVADYVDSYLAQIEPFRRFWFHSDLADAKAYNTFDRYESEASPDRLVTLKVNHREVWVFNERTIEPFINVGAAQGTFQRAGNTVIERGCAAANSVALLDNGIAWLGNNGIVYLAQGYTPQRISTKPLESAIRDLEWSQAFAFVWNDSGHEVYYLTFPDGQTFGFDVSTQEWHRRESDGLKRWRVNALTFWRGKWIAGDAFTGKLFEMDWDAYTEDGAPLVRKRVSAILHGHQQRILIPYAEAVVTTGEAIPENALLADDGGELVVDDLDDAIVLEPFDGEATLMLRYSDDGGRTWSDWRYRSLGRQGEYARRVRFNRLGATRNRVWEIRATSPSRCDLISASAMLEVTDA